MQAYQIYTKYTNILFLSSTYPKLRKKSILHLIRGGKCIVEMANSLNFLLMLICQNTIFKKSGMRLFRFLADFRFFHFKL